ncbi:dTDP-glucose 4,6-dehydratase [Alicyclobacillus cellulosilyticus]|uniref:dTDP-glucose 4,6-dehydratase n=1 Tax=Alicyclobacillus cellulosilyticus TaxID=1003997 RepID=A0A917K5T2_9BACL|nr:NAD(P)-dependent oxidoreductase [Alicyclobacillus cellulosilyticus]GGJ00081.1 dTDP-glucose 4,6-dehydratase [Alicyclobacillus cellulosilyticus]
MTTLITGGCGFVGATLVRKLRQQGEEVVSIDRRFTEGNTGDPGHHYYQADILDVGRLVELMQRHRVARVIHTAAISHPVVSREVPYQTVMVNALGTAAVFEAARVAGVRRVVNFSSECAYGNNRDEGVVFETSRLLPTTPYGVTKVFTEHLARVYSDLYGMEIPSLRPGWIYGPGQFMQCYLKTMLRNAIDGVPTVEEQGGEYRFQYVHVEDVADAAWLAATVPGVGAEVFNITAGVQHSYWEVAAEVKKLFPDAVIDIGPGTIDVLDENGVFDITKAQRVLGWRPRYDLASGIRQYAAWLREHPY